MNKKYVAVGVLLVGLVVFPQTTHAFSIKNLFSSIFGGVNTQTTQPAASLDAFSGTKTETTTTPPIIKDEAPAPTPEPQPLPAPVITPKDIIPTKDISPVKINTSSTTETPPILIPRIKDTKIQLIYGTKGDSTVVQLQRKLKALGYFSGPINGSYGKMTAAAVAAFKKDKNIEGGGTGVGLATLKALAIKVSPTTTDGPKTTSCSSYQYLTQWGTVGTGSGQFNQPDDVAIDSSGNVYIADLGNYRIQKFTSNGTFVSQFGLANLGPNTGITINQSSGDIYVLYEAVGTVVKYNSNGQYVSQFGFNAPYFNYRLATNSSTGNVYVGDDSFSDPAHSHVNKYTSNGTFISQWGGLGSGNGQFNTPYGIAIDSSGNVYVADEFNNRIQKFTADGVYLTQWGTAGTGGNATFNNPTGISVDSLDDVYVVDSQNLVQKFTSNGTFITQWGGSGTGNGQFNVPKGLAIDSSGYVYVADAGNNRIQKFGCTTQQVPSITVVSPNGGEIYDINQSIPVKWQTTNIPSTDWVIIHVLQYDSSGNVIASVSPHIGTAGTPMTLNTGSAILDPLSSVSFPTFVPGAHYKVIIQRNIGGNPPFSGNVDPNTPPGLSSNLFTINNSTPPPASTCSISSFIVPVSTTLASGLKARVSWSSNCDSVMLEANSGSYTLRYVGGSSGTHEFSAPLVGTTFSSTDSDMHIAVVAGNTLDTVSAMKSVPITDVKNPPANQCAFTSLTANPNPATGGQSLLSWVAPVGCIVYVESWTASPTGLAYAHIFKPGTYYFDSTDSVTVPISNATSYYVSAQAGTTVGSSSTMVLSANTIDVKVK